MVESLYESKNYAARVRKLLKNCSDFEIRIGPHITKKRLPQRQIKIEVVWRNIHHPTDLYHAKKRKKSKKYEESYKCYFRMSGQQCHIYGIVFNFRYKFIKLTTVIKDRIKLQRKFKYVKS